MSTCTRWFQEAKWGVFCHYLASDELTAAQWNAQVDSFDTDALAAQLAEVGASYFFITLGQNSGHYCSPNATYDRFVGISPSKCSKRDLVADLYQAVSKRGIKLLAYLPAGAPDRDPVAMEKLEWKNGKYHDYAFPDGPPADAQPDDRLVNFQLKWETVITEWSQRWGDKIRGWWIDGCYFAKAMYRHPDRPNFASFAAALKSGNPQAIVAFNPGVRVPVIRYTECEDYTAGEINDAFPITPKSWQPQIIDGKVDDAQYHLLSFLGKDWGTPPPRLPDELARGYTKFVNQLGGVMTWDVPIQKNGRIPGEFYRQLKAIGQPAQAISNTQNGL